MRCFVLSVQYAFLLMAGSAVADDRSPRLSPSITSDMLFEGREIKPSSTPDDPRIYLQGRNGKVDRLKQPNGYPKFPKSDQMLADGEEAQFHQGRDFPTPTPTSFMAGVHGTVIYAKD